MYLYHSLIYKMFRVQKLVHVYFLDIMILSSYETLGV